MTDLSLHHNTPSVTVLDNRGLTVRDIAYHRLPVSSVIPSAQVPDADERVTRHWYDARGFLKQSADPRLGKAELANFTYLTDLAGTVLLAQGVDNGITVALNDAAGRPFMTVGNINTVQKDGKEQEDRSQAVTRTWQYEDAALPGRPLSITEQAAGEKNTRVTERFVWAGNGDEEKVRNLAGLCVSHYDTAGLVQTDRVALTGMPLTVTRHLLKDADSPDSVADWQGDGASACNGLLAAEAHTTLTTADATGAVLTTTDAKGNRQRVTYDVAGLLSGSWLTLKDGTEQVIVASLTYSAAGQKLREEHSNGVVTTYEFEPETQRLTGIKTERPAGHKSGQKVLQDLRYEYDPVGNVLKISNDAEKTCFWRNQKVVPENTYVYDSLYQLVSATGREMAGAGQGSHLPSPLVPLPIDNSAYTHYTRTYGYDSAGNLMRINHIGASQYTTLITVSDRSNRAVPGGENGLTENPADVDAMFTAGGQQTQLLRGQNLHWTPHNELLKVTLVVREDDTNDSESYCYDADSQRILKVSVQKTGNSMQTQRVLYLPGLELRTTKAGDTETESLQVITVGEAGRAQVRVLHQESGRPDGISNNQIRYSYDNLTGSGTLELDGDGNIISKEEYYPYGGTAVWATRGQTEADYKTVRYSGKERDATGLYYYGYRYYQPWAGRWLNADPVGSVGGLNLFRMVRNNPLTYHDPQGNIEERVIYGFSHWRGHFIGDAIRNKVTPLTIDEFNSGLGIMGNMSIEKYFSIHEMLKSGTPSLDNNAIRENSKKYTDADSNIEKDVALGMQRSHTLSWFSYLSENKEKIDIQSKINNLKPSGKAFFSKFKKNDYSKLDEFIYKNSEGTTLSIGRQRELLINFAESKGNDSINKDEKSFLTDTVATAFFRQTSKLGMSWFIDNIGVNDFIFVNADHDGNKLNFDELEKNKIWKTGGRRKIAQLEYAEAITFSEVRNAIRKGYSTDKIKWVNLKS